MHPLPEEYVEQKNSESAIACTIFMTSASLHSVWISHRDKEKGKTDRKYPNED